jgi:hypothetical protein
MILWMPDGSSPPDSRRCHSLWSSHGDRHSCPGPVPGASYPSVDRRSALRAMIPSAVNTCAGVLPQAIGQWRFRVAVLASVPQGFILDPWTKLPSGLTQALARLFRVAANPRSGLLPPMKPVALPWWRPVAAFPTRPAETSASRCQTLAGCRMTGCHH